LASLKNHLVELFLDSISRLESLSVRLEEGQERHDVVLRSHVAHGVECAHEAEGSLHLPLCELPVLFEQEEREDSGDAFTSETKGELAFVGVIEATSSVLVFLQVENRGLHEAIKAHEGGDDGLDGQLGGVHDSRFRTTNL